jgi:hypothetical protein
VTLTRFSFRYDNSTTLKDGFEIIQINISISHTGSRAHRDDNFLRGELNDK